MLDLLGLPSPSLALIVATDSSTLWPVWLPFVTSGASPGCRNLTGFWCPTTNGTLRDGLLIFLLPIIRAFAKAGHFTTTTTTMVPFEQQSIAATEGSMLYPHSIRHMEMDDISELTFPIEDDRRDDENFHQNGFHESCLFPPRMGRRMNVDRGDLKPEEEHATEKAYPTIIPGVDSRHGSAFESRRRRASSFRNCFFRSKWRRQQAQNITTSFFDAEASNGIQERYTEQKSSSIARSHRAITCGLMANPKYNVIVRVTLSRDIVPYGRTLVRHGA